MSKEIKLFFLHEQEKKERPFSVELIRCGVEKTRGGIHALFATSSLDEIYPGLYQDENGFWRMQDEEKLREEILASMNKEE